MDVVVDVVGVDPEAGHVEVDDLLGCVRLVHPLRHLNTMDF